MNKNSTHINDDLIVKYLLEEADPDERVQVEEWINADQNNLKYFNDFRLLIEASELNPDNKLNEYKALDRLHARMEREQAVKQRTPLPLRLLIQIAATVILVGTITWLTYPLLSGSSKEVDVQTTGNVLKQTLPDDTQVTLNKNSSLSYPGKFSDTIRLVRLNGEAFFQVQSDKSKPFIIMVNEVKVRVVGTSFNIKSRNNQTVVVVQTGLVRVSKQGDHIELRAGERTRISPGTATLSKEPVKGTIYNYYYSNELICDRTPLWELVEVLNDKFDTTIIIATPSLRNLPITTVFTDKSLEEILQVIASTFDMKVVRNGHQILLK